MARTRVPTQRRAKVPEPDTLPNILQSPGPTGGQPDGEFPTADT